MARPAVYEEAAMLDATRDLVLEVGPRAVGIREIARRTGAPSGSLYHRFRSRDDVLAVAWLRAVRRFQAGVLAALEADDAREAVARAVRWSVEFALSAPADTELLLRFSRADLMDGEPGPEIARELADVNAALELAVRRLAERLFGKREREAVERTTYAVIDLPYAVLRRHLLAGTLDHRVTALLERVALAIVGEGEETYR
jgi:AcrR family transcriptional regulator